MVTNCCLLFQLLPARLGELLDCDLQNILRFVIISSQSRAVVRQNRTCDIGLTLISEPVTYQWGGQAGPECTSPRGPGKNVLSTAQNLLVITIHNYLCCTSVLCTSVKLSADLNCTETRLAAGPAWAATALLAQTLCRYTVAGREGRGRNGLGAGRWRQETEGRDGVRRDG